MLDEHSLQRGMTALDEAVGERIAEPGYASGCATALFVPTRTVTASRGRNKQRPKGNHGAMPSSSTAKRHGRYRAATTPRIANTTA